MSIGEIIVVLVVALLVIKPEDIPGILRQVKSLRGYFIKTKDSFLSEINKELEIEDKSITDSVEEINFYLEKILSIEGKYEGPYELASIKNKYNELIKKQLELNKVPSPEN
jgi:Sec-independent protein translocase protein TatA